MRKITMLFAALLISMAAFSATIIEGTKLYVQLPTSYRVLSASVVFGESSNNSGKLNSLKPGTSIGGGTTGTAMTNVDEENGIWEVVAPAGISDSIFNVTLAIKSYSAACVISNLKYDGEHNLFILSSDFAYDMRRGGTATEENGTWGVYPSQEEPEAGITATWSIEEGAVLDGFEGVTVTFAGIDSVGRNLDGVEVQKAVAQGSSTNVLFYEVAEDGTLTPVDNGTLYSKTENLSITYTATVDKGYQHLVDGKYMKQGNYRIVIDAGDVLFTPNRTSPAPKVYNDQTYVLNFSIVNDYEVAPTIEEVDATYTVDPVTGNVTEIKTVALTFTDATALTLAEIDETPNAMTWAFCNQVAEYEGMGTMVQPIAPMVASVEGNKLILTIASQFIGGQESITAVGSYSVTIPAGMIFFDETHINKAITLNYTIAEPETAITATWDIEEGATLEEFTSATLTFTGVESAKAKSAYSNYFFYKVAEDGTKTLVPSMCSDGYMDAAAEGTSVTFSIDTETCYLDMPQYGAFFALTTGDYCVEVPAGAIQFNNDATNLNKEAYVLNFHYVAPEPAVEVDAAYTVNPENNATVAEITDIVINFTEYETIAVAEPDLSSGSNIPTVSIFYEDYGMNMPAGYMMFEADANSANGLRLYVDPAYAQGMESFAVEGVYTITIPAGVVTFADGISKTITLTYTVAEPEPVTITGTVKRALQTGTASIVLTHEADGTAHIYSVDNETLEITEISQEGVIARDAENAGDYLALSDIALTTDGKLVACNYIRTQSDVNQVATDYKRGMANFYIWNDLAAAPALWFQSKAASNSLTSDQGYTMAVKGSSTDAEILVSGLRAEGSMRYSLFKIIDGVYTDIDQDAGITLNDHYFYFGLIKDNANFKVSTHGENYQFSVLPNGNWVYDGELAEPSEISEPEGRDKASTTLNPTVEGVIAEGVFGKKFNGASYLTVGEQVFMAAPYADVEGKLAGVKVLDITNGFADAVELEFTATLETAVEVESAAATLVAGEEGFVTVCLFAGSEIYTFEQSIVVELPMEVEFENIAAIYEMGMWDMAYYESYSQYDVLAVLKSQPTVVEKVVAGGMMGSVNNYYLNDGTGVIVLQAPASGESMWGEVVEGLEIEVGQKLPADFTATIDFKCVIDDETWMPTGEVYGAPVMSFVSKVIGVDEEGWEIAEPYADFVARCEASDFVEEAVEVSAEELLANRMGYAGQLLTLNAEANYYAEVNPYMGGMSAYMYWDAVEAFDVETYEEEGETYVFVSPKMTEDWNNYAGKLFNVQGEGLEEAAFDANATIDVVTARFDWNAIAQGQTLLVKEYTVDVPEENPVDVENSELVVNVYANNGAVYVETEAGVMIEVYTVNGLRVYAGVSNTNTTVINGLTDVAIIRVNGVAYKVFVK